MSGEGLASADLAPASVAGADLSWRGIPADGSGIDGSTKIAFGSVDLLEIADDAIASHHIRTQAVGASELATLTTVERTVSVPPAERSEASAPPASRTPS